MFEHDAPARNPDPAADIVARGRALLDDGKPAEALALFARSAPDLERTPELFGGAIDALFACIDRDLWPDWTDEERDTLFETLIDQRFETAAPPLLHHRIAGQQNSSVAGILGRMAGLLRPALTRLTSAKASRNTVLMLLLLRDVIDWIGQDEISRLHLLWFARFRYEDLAIPYNLMFAHGGFARNRDDIRGEIDRCRDAILGGGVWPLAQCVFADWMTGGALFADRTGFVAALLAAQPAAARSAEDGQAARWLLVRYGACEAADTEGAGPGLRAIVAEKRGGPPPLPSGVAWRLIQSKPWQAVQAARCCALGRAPFVPSLSRKPRIALCVSGQLRGFRQALDSWRRTILRGVDAHIFVHSWSRIGASGAEPFRHDLPFAGDRFVAQYRAICLAIGLPDVIDRYPALFRKLAATGVVTANQLAEIYRTPHVHIDEDADEPFRSWTNPQKMHRKLEACYDMAMADDGDFDLMIRLRPDKPIKLQAFDWGSMRRFCGANRYIFADHAMDVHFATLMIGDQFAMGHVDAMADYSRTASRYDRIAQHDLLRMPGALTGHISLAQTCRLNGIAVGKVPLRFGGLQDPGKVSVRDIADCLRIDAEGRMDATDRLLIDANAADLSR